MVTLLILDGYGESKNKEGNAIYNNSKKIDYYKKKYPFCLLNASGEAVGLQKGQMGNSECGHLNIGSGRIVLQDFCRINKLIELNKLKENKTLLEASEHCINNNSCVHIMGLLSDGGVHSSIQHFKEVIKILKNNGINKIFFHAFLDGRDTYFDSGLKYFQEFEKFLKIENIGNIASISGRIYSMDRENRYDRIEKVYNMLTGISNIGYEESDNLEESILNSYKKNIYDEYVNPTKFKNSPFIQDNDVIISLNFRADRMRELINALTQKTFKEFQIKKLKNLFVCTMTEYDKNFKKIKVILPKQKIKNCLSEVLSRYKIKQYKVTETTKYAHITYFFNGGEEKKFEGEKRILIESIDTKDFSKYPKMKAKDITKNAINAINSKEYGFILINLSNADMIGHTGNFKATKKAIKYIDYCSDKIVKATLINNGHAIITADHGNAECMLNRNKIVTSHSSNPVPFILISEKYRNSKLKNNQSIASIAPTVLDILNIKKPKEMTQNSLLLNTLC